MSEKLTESITFKCTYEEKRDLEAIAKSDSKTLSEHIRSLGMSNISEVRERLNNLASLMRLTTDTVDTSFELQAPPRFIDVTPKPQAQKKAQLREQLDFLAVHSEK
ncbi:hypothetical protein [Acinetobacter sp. MF4640]|uniref:hypothetical protein n=1 Tax=Acinetobacter sp. MF4640 TaxID=1960826 RepID=UPI000994A579|nr:hypothetical protein [Acinetobacter sp. MF4640]OOW12626.1 hypothetical protein MF4640_12045 [Acinetobacter sp. MF4640]